MAIEMTGWRPRVMSAVDSRIVYIGLAVALITGSVIAYGLSRSAKQQAERKKVVVSQIAATDAAVSNRTEVLAGAPLSTIGGGLPTQPGVNTPGMIPSAANSLASTGTNAFKTVASPMTACQGPLAAQTPGCPQMAVNTPPMAYSASYPMPVQPEVDPVVKLRREKAAHEFEREQAAIEAPIRGTVSPSTPTAANPLQDGLDRIAALPPGTPGMPLGVYPPSPAGSNGQAEEDPNGHDAKRVFQHQEEGDYLKTTRVAPISPWVVERGEVIPAGLPSAVVSDLPGDLIAEVKRDVYDTPTHRYVMIPAGSLLSGEYNSSVSYGQNRIQVIWRFLRFPDGSYIDLDRFVSHAADGSTGLKDIVDNHYKRLIGGIALSSLFAAGIQISQNHTNSGGSTLAYPSNTQIAASAAGQQAGQVGEQITQRNLNVQPSVKIRPGEIFSVSVSKNMVFPGPYVPMTPGGGK